MIDSVIYGCAWAGLVMLFQFSMWEDNLLDGYYNYLKTLPEIIAKPLGLCTVCFGLWFGLLFAYLNIVDNYAVFIGISEVVLVLYTCLLEKWFGK